MKKASAVLFFSLAVLFLASGLRASTVYYCDFEAKVVSYDKTTRKIKFKVEKLLRKEGPEMLCKLYLDGEVEAELKEDAGDFVAEQAVLATYQEIYNVIQNGDKVDHKRWSEWKVRPKKP